MVLAAMVTATGVPGPTEMGHDTTDLCAADYAWSSHKTTGTWGLLLLVMGTFNE